jgi:hypothetical protein
MATNQMTVPPVSRELWQWIATEDMIRESFRQWSEDINLVFFAEDLKGLKIGRYRFS